ncbi:hypothetical protein LEP1GSC050_2807 [Leptospira broomii serovar Hurstbridge str. 5399]|uniref:Uncharacterized protein n=1 Tax=Leptospira broomii serovar Hurstbridge str. 5399 TaxID=1049789 RepID=T0GF54_9LEPT|nr:hypothetical protein [Leptospira broomii]EQA44033.1 hypothetical protein LEP1GSC050_2807 [Leptospira broomii serovar Hurstbridge str. 5399]
MNKIFGLSFDLDTASMTDSGVTESERTKMYAFELPIFLSELGFAKHELGSVYKTALFDNSDSLIKALKKELEIQKPKFAYWIKSCAIFVLEPWSDVTLLLKYGSSKPKAEKRNLQKLKGKRKKVKQSKKLKDKKSKGKLNEEV